MPTFDEYKTQGNLAFSQKQYTRAAKIYRDAITHYGDNPIIYLNRAQCFLHLKDWKRGYRDAEAGLNCGPTQPIRVKLLFRKGLAAKELGLELESVACFQQVLALDPANRGAKDELEKLSSPPQSKKMKADSKPLDRKIIPLEIVDELPREFAEIVWPPAKSVSEPAPPANLKLIESEIEELFSDRKNLKKAESALQEDAQPTQSFASMPSMQFLTALKKVPTEKKATSYQYVVGLDDTTLLTLFQDLGVDHEFFEFFLEASAYTISHDSDPRTSTQATLQTLKHMSSFKRYSLTLTMCDSNLLQHFIGVVSEASPLHLGQIQQVLGIQK